MTALLEARQNWSPEVKPIYLRYPAAIRSSKWPEILQLAKDGKKAEAMELAKSTDRNKAIHAENVMARRIRLQRVALFNLQRSAVREINERFRTAGLTMGLKIQKHADGLSTIKKITGDVHDEIVFLRRDLNRRITDFVWKSILMGIKHMGAAIEPVFKENEESFREELTLLSEFNVFERVLMEEGDDEDEPSDTFGIRPDARRQATARITSPKWVGITDKIYLDIAKKNLQGLTLSERIWDLTNRAEQDLKRLMASEIAKGTSPRNLADQVQRYVYTSGIDADFETGPGIYRSPLKNAMRLTRTEINRSYTKGTAAWAKDKSWLAGIRITLSDAHDKEDICDERAGDLVTPEEFAELVPFHPHCMCHAVYVMKEEELTDDNDLQDEEAA